jgi:hypothetical protein
VRQFAQPIIENVVTEMKTFDNQNEINKKIEYDNLKEIQKIKNKEFTKIKKEPLFHVTSKNFESLIKRCDKIQTKKINSKCKKDFKEKIKDILQKIKEYKKKLFKEYQDEFKKVDALLKLNKPQNSKQRILDKDKQTIYYNLLEKCKVQISKINQIHGVQENLQTILEIKEEIKLLKKQKSLLTKSKEDTSTIDRNIKDKLKMIEDVKRDIIIIKKDYKKELNKQKKEELERERQQEKNMKNIKNIEDYYKEDIEYVSDELRDLMTQWKIDLDQKIEEMEKEYNIKEENDKRIQDKAHEEEKKKKENNNKK